MLALHFWELLARVPPHHDLSVKIEGRDDFELDVLDAVQYEAGEWALKVSSDFNHVDALITRDQASEVRESLKDLPGNLGKLSAMEIQHVYRACIEHLIPEE